MQLSNLTAADIQHATIDSLVSWHLQALADAEAAAITWRASPLETAQRSTCYIEFLRLQAAAKSLEVCKNLRLKLDVLATETHCLTSDLKNHSLSVETIYNVKAEPVMHPIERANIEATRKAAMG